MRKSKLGRVFFLLTTLLILHSPNFATQVQDDPEKVVLSNRFLSREISFSGRVVRTTAIENKLTKARLEIFSKEFLLELDGGKYLTTSDFSLSSKSSHRTASGGSREEFILINQAEKLEVKIEYQLEPDEFYMRKRLFIRGTGLRQPIIRRLEVERLAFKRKTSDFSDDELDGYRVDPPTQKEIALGGLGQPVFVGNNIFIGLEYPAAHNTGIGTDGTDAKDETIVICAHHPGRRVKTEYWGSKSAVLGVSQTGEVEEYFMRYLWRVRIPPRFNLIYGSWFDVRGKEMTPEYFLHVEDGFRKSLTEKYGVKLDTIQIDASYENVDSTLWMPNPEIYPYGLGPLAKELERRGTQLGLWMPLVGFAYYQNGNRSRNYGTNMEWGIKQGLEISNFSEERVYIPNYLNLYTGEPLLTDLPKFYCLSAPNYNREIRETIRFHIEKSQARYFSHDFCWLYCSGEGHGHIPEQIYGLEANVDAQIELLNYQRELRPDIYLVATSGMWLSPWWLEYADSIFRGYSDTDMAYVENLPAIRQRDHEMSYVDSTLYNNFRRDRFQFPISALMYVSTLIYGKVTMPGGKEESLDSWADYVVHTLGRGTRLQDFYLNPYLLSQEKWEVLGRTLLWTRANADLLLHGKMAGGDPKKGEAYGVVHWRNGRGILCLRNPSIDRRLLKIKLQGLPKTPMRLMITYPYRQIFSKKYEHDEEVALELDSYQVMVIEAYPQDNFPYTQMPQDIRYSVVEEKLGAVVLDVLADRSRVRLERPETVKAVRVNGVAVDISRDGGIIIGGKPQPGEEIRWQHTGPDQIIVRLSQRYLNHTQLFFLIESQGTTGQMKAYAPVVEVNGHKVQTEFDPVAVSSSTKVSRVAGFSVGVPLKLKENRISWVFPGSDGPKGVPGTHKTSVWAIVQAPLRTVRLSLDYKTEAISSEKALLPTPLFYTERQFYVLNPF